MGQNLYSPLEACYNVSIVIDLESKESGRTVGVGPEENQHCLL